MPACDERNRQRLEIAKRMTPDKIPPLAVGLMLDGAAGVTGQVFGARMNELMLFNQSRPIRTTQASEGWTPQTVVSHCLGGATPVVFSARPFVGCVHMGLVLNSQKDKGWP